MNANLAFCVGMTIGSIITSIVIFFLIKHDPQYKELIEALTLYLKDYIPEHNHFAGDVDMNCRRKNLWDKFQETVKGNNAPRS